MSKTKQFQQTVLRGHAGVFAVASELARQHWIPALTPDNIPDIDILAVKDDYSRQIAVQVKELSSKNRGAGWQIRPDRILSQIRYVLVEMPEDGGRPEFFVLRAEELKDRTHSNMKMPYAKISKQEQENYHNRWDKL
jgi:hypothetical protein